MSMRKSSMIKLSMRKAVLAAMAAGVTTLAPAGAARAEGPQPGQSLDLNLRPNLGKPITPQDLAPWNITILPDGSNLPPGSGRAVDHRDRLVWRGRRHEAGHRGADRRGVGQLEVAGGVRERGLAEPPLIACVRKLIPT